MANATIIAIADAMVGELNDQARTWAGRFQAERHYNPLFPEPASLALFDTLQVRVIPRARPHNVLIARRPVGVAAYGRDQEHRIDIVVQQRPTPAGQEPQPADFDPLELLTEQIEAWFLNDQHAIAASGVAGGARVVESVIDPWPAMDHLEQYGIFTAVIQTTAKAYV